MLGRCDATFGWARKRKCRCVREFSRRALARKRHQVHRAEQTDQATGAATFEATIPCEHRNVQDLRQRDVFSVVGLGPAQLIGDLPRLAPKVRRVQALDRSRIQVPKGVVRQLVRDVAAISLLMQPGQRLRPEQRRGDERDPGDCVEPSATARDPEGGTGIEDDAVDLSAPIAAP
jgi:hypothetical protein